MNVNLIIFTMVGGLALFLYGMKMLSDGLQMAFGDRLRILLEKLTDNKMKGVGVGAMVTAIIQSSSITTVTLVGLINAGLITLNQSVPVIMGANIGTTITAQLVAFKIGKYALPVIAIGFFIYTIGRMTKWKFTGQVILGFGILFLGMNLMSSEVKELTKDPRIMNMIARMGENPLLGILAGALFTAVVQSSSATSGLVISLALGDKSLINLPSAIALIFGANIGTCITVVLASIGSSLSSKRAAATHVLFNILGVLIFVPFLGAYAGLVAKTSANLPRQIANAHMFFNMSNTLVLLPFSGVIVAMVMKILPGKEANVEKGIKFLDDRTLSTPSMALRLAELETIRMAEISRSMIDSAWKALKEKDPNEVAVVKESEAVVDQLDCKIELFLNRIDKENLTGKQRSHLATYNHAIQDLERISDHANNICELAEMRMNRKIQFSEDEFKELHSVFKKARKSIEKCQELLEEGDEGIVKEIMAIEEEVDNLVDCLEVREDERLRNGETNAEAGPVYMDILRNLERITDHSHNVACAKSLGF